MGLDKGELRYADLRKLRGVWLASDDEEVTGVMGELGPDALSMNLRSFAAALRGHRGGLKSVLMDQAVIAGTRQHAHRRDLLASAAASVDGQSPTSSQDEMRRLHATMKGASCRTAVRHGRVRGCRGGSPACATIPTRAARAAARG